MLKGLGHRRLRPKERPLQRSLREPEQTLLRVTKRSLGAKKSSKVQGVKRKSDTSWKDLLERLKGSLSCPLWSQSHQTRGKVKRRTPVGTESLKRDASLKWSTGTSDISTLKDSKQVPEPETETPGGQIGRAPAFSRLKSSKRHPGRRAETRPRVPGSLTQSGPNKVRVGIQKKGTKLT